MLLFSQTTCPLSGGRYTPVFGPGELSTTSANVANSQQQLGSLTLLTVTKYVLLLSLLSLIFSCKKKEDEVIEPYAFLKGTWQYANGAECVFDVATKTAKGTKVPTNNTQFKFVVGEDYWRNVTSTGTDAWSYDQIVRYSDGKTVEYRKSTMAKKDANTLSIATPGISDTELKRVQ